MTNTQNPLLRYRIKMSLRNPEKGPCSEHLLILSNAIVLMTHRQELDVTSDLLQLAFPFCFSALYEHTLNRDK